MPQNRKLLIEGWRSISHSYAVVNQWQILALHKRGDLDLFFKDIPFFSSSWAAQKNLFSKLDESYISDLEECRDECADAVLRISFPFNFSNTTKSNYAIFGTSEYKLVPTTSLKSYADFKSSINQTNIKIFTPSNWSAEGFYRQGYQPDQVVIIPHGVDIQTFHISNKTRQKVRTQLGTNVFVFMCVVGAMTTNKGIDLLLSAFTAVVEERPEARLLLKGSDDLYFSNSKFKEYLNNLSVKNRETILKNCIYHGASLSMHEMAEFYQIADAYVSPYRAEGFNLPVLEAAACGVPIICSSGGSTDDFVTDGFAYKINSKIESLIDNEGEKERLAPDIDHLIQLMIEIIDNEDWRNRAATMAVNHIVKNFTWDSVADQITRNLFANCT